MNEPLVPRTPLPWSPKFSSARGGGSLAYAFELSLEPRSLTLAAALFAEHAAAQIEVLELIVVIHDILQHLPACSTNDNTPYTLWLSKLFVNITGKH
jgi:hypothetical protein